MKQRNNKIIIYNDRIVIMNFYVFSDASFSHLMVGLVVICAIGVCTNERGRRCARFYQSGPANTGKGTDSRKNNKKY